MLQRSVTLIRRLLCRRPKVSVRGFTPTPIVCRRRTWEVYNGAVGLSITHNYGVRLGDLSQSQRERIEAAIQEAAKELTPDIVRIRYSLDEDSGGAAAIFFRVVLTDQAASKSRLHPVSARAAKILLKHVRPDEMGLQFYFNYRSKSEQASLRDRAWA